MPAIICCGRCNKPVSEPAGYYDVKIVCRRCRRMRMIPCFCDAETGLLEDGSQCEEVHAADGMRWCYACKGEGNEKLKLFCDRKHASPR
jgi:hypothetical protein